MEKGKPFLFKAGVWWRVRTVAGIICVFFMVILIAYSAGTTMEYDFGKVSPRQKVKHTFEFAEELKSVASLCECIHLKIIDTGPFPTGERHGLEIEFDPSGYSGDTVEEVVVIDVNDTVTRIRIKAFVGADLYFRK